ncbi:MAG TPA: FMN-binding protein [Candidatus Limnocylindria bacterium]|nr:FMN-binding protein [Candidatus Limnocylindria bacterium]
MKRGHVYTLVFMVVCAVALTLALALAYEGFKPRIARNRALREQRAVLYALGVTEPMTDEQAVAAFEERVAPAEGAPVSAQDKPILTYTEGGETLAYAVPFEGGALWGTIAGYLGVNADRTELTGLSFTAQNETPGLGGRIEETGWLEQFRGLPISEGEEVRYGTGDGWRIDAVTGATQTSAAVIRVINRTLRERVFSGEVE